MDPNSPRHSQDVQSLPEWHFLMNIDPAIDRRLPLAMLAPGTRRPVRLLQFSPATRPCLHLFNALDFFYALFERRTECLQVGPQEANISAHHSQMGNLLSLHP